MCVCEHPEHLPYECYFAWVCYNSWLSLFFMSLILQQVCLSTSFSWGWRRCKNKQISMDEAISSLSLHHICSLIDWNESYGWVQSYCFPPLTGGYCKVIWQKGINEGRSEGSVPNNIIDCIYLLCLGSQNYPPCPFSSCFDLVRHPPCLSNFPFWNPPTLLATM